MYNLALELKKESQHDILNLKEMLEAELADMKKLSRAAILTYIKHELMIVKIKAIDWNIEYFTHNLNRSTHITYFVYDCNNKTIYDIVNSKVDEVSDETYLDIFNYTISFLEKNIARLTAAIREQENVLRRMQF